MKQIQKTDRIINLLAEKVGADMDANKVVVFEAIALNTLPLRKKHPLYNTSRVDQAFLHEMAAAVLSETVPMQIQHDKEPLPIGRVFHAEVVGSELRALFFIDETEKDLITKIEAGSVDQVSVSILPKHIYNSASNFDYLGPDASLDNVWTGTDNDGNTIGEKGVYGKLVGLDQWYEMSLVGKGGAQNARIVHRDSSHFGSSYEKLAASGVDPNALVLVASVEEDNKMDLNALVASLSDEKAAGIVKDQKIVSLEASVTDLTTKNGQLSADLATAQADAPAVTAELAETKTALEAAQADAKAATDALKDVAQKILTASGKVNEQVPETVSDLTALIADGEKGLAAALVAGGKSQDANSGDTSGQKRPVNLGAFRTGSRR